VFETALLHIFQLRFTFFSQTVSAPRTQFEKKEWSCERASKEVLHELQFFVELLYSGVCGTRVLGAVPNTPLEVVW
jgi:hypothetical protein